MIYIICGEPYQGEQFIAKVKEKRIREGFEYYSFTTDEFQDGLEDKLRELLTSPSLFSKKKIIIVKGTSVEWMKNFLKHQGRSIDDDILFWTAVQKRISISYPNVVIKYFEVPKGKALREFIHHEFERRKAKPNSLFVYSLLRMERQLTTLYPLINEIEKVTIAPLHAGELFTILNGSSPFSLTDAIMRKNKGEVLRLLERELQRGVKPFDIINRVIWQLRILLLVESFKFQASSFKLPLHPFVIKKAREALHLFSPSELTSLYLGAISIYEKILFSGLPSELLLSRFFWRL